MADLFARLAERTLGVAVVARPVIPPAFAPAPQVAVEAVTEAPRATLPPELAPAPEPKLAQRRHTVARVEESSFKKAPPLHEAPLVVKARPSNETRDPIQRSEQPTALPAATLKELESESRVEGGRYESEEPDTRPVDRRPLQHEITPLAESRPEAAAPPARRPRVDTTLDAEQTPVRGATFQSAEFATRALVGKPPAPARDTRRHEQEPADSTVQVNIGRIEVRAVFPEPQPLAGVPRASDSALSLGDYLKERDRGTR